MTRIMKAKTMMTALLGSMFLLTACGGSKTVEVKDAKVGAGTSAPRYEVIANAVSAVPGQYEMTWAKSSEYNGFTQFNITLKVRLEKRIDLESDPMLKKEVLGNLMFKLVPLDADGREFTPEFTSIVWKVGKTFGDTDEDLAKLRDLLTTGEVGSEVEINFFCMPNKESESDAVKEKTEKIQLFVGV